MLWRTDTITSPSVSLKRKRPFPIQVQNGERDTGGGRDANVDTQLPAPYGHDTIRSGQLQAQILGDVASLVPGKDLD